MPNPFSIDILNDNYDKIKKILDKYDMRTDVVYIYGLSVGGLFRWETSLDLLVLPKDGKKLISINFENCNKELENLLGAQVSTFTEELIRKNEEKGAIEAGTFNSIQQELIAIQDLFKFNKLFALLEKQDFHGFQKNIEKLPNENIYKELLPSNLGKLTLLHYAVEFFSPPIIDFILKNNPDINLEDFKKMTATQRLIKKLYDEFFTKNVIDKEKTNYLKILLENGAKLTTKDSILIEKIAAKSNDLFFKEILKHAREFLKQKNETTVTNLNKSSISNNNTLWKGGINSQPFIEKEEKSMREEGESVEKKESLDVRVLAYLKANTNLWRSLEQSPQEWERIKQVVEQELTDAYYNKSSVIAK